jgi:hypothetical protein
MLSKLRRYHPSHATVVAYLALFVALGGSSYAALKITSRNVPKDALTGADIKKLTGRDVINNSLTGADVKKIGTGDVTDSSLLAQDFAPGQLPEGPPGEPNPNAQNSDKLDNLDSTEFVRGTGKTVGFSTLTPRGNPSVWLGPANWKVGYYCPLDLTSPGSLTFMNTSATPIDAFAYRTSEPSVAHVVLEGGDSVSPSFTSGPATYRFDAHGFPDGSVVTVWAAKVHKIASNSCLLQVTAIEVKAD